MRGAKVVQSAMFSCVTLERRVPAGHPLREIRVLVDRALERTDGELGAMYARLGRPSVSPEKLLRASLLQILYSVPSERRMMEQLDYNLLFRWFVGLEMDDAVWDVTVFTENRERLRWVDNLFVINPLREVVRLLWHLVTLAAGCRPECAPT